MTPAPIGLLAGAGRLPVIVAAKARDLGIPVVCVGVAGMADPKLARLCPRFVWLRRMAMGSVIRTFRRGGVREWAMAGKFHKHVLFKPWRWLQLLPDLRVIRFWFSHRRRDNADDSLLLGIIAEFRKDGLECVSPLALVPEILVREGVLTRRRPTPAEERDIAFGWHLAKEMGRLDVGQSVAVRDRAVLAVEAIEGTDFCIRRAGELCRGGGFVVVKVAKPQQDMRFDVPTVGEQTIRVLHAAGGRVLAVEAGKTILIDEAATLALADKCGIAITAVGGSV